LAFSLIAFPTAAAADPATTASESAIDTELLDRTLGDFYDSFDHSVVVDVRDGDESWSDARGPRRVNGWRQAEPTDRVRIASLTKSMVATVLLQMQDEGKLDFDDPIDAYLPGLVPFEDQPTVRQLLNHTGGLADYFLDLYPSLAEGDPTDIKRNHKRHYTPEQLVAFGTQYGPLFEPGEYWWYSNAGYTVLGLLVEELSGNSLRAELDARIFAPLGLRHTDLPRYGSNGFTGSHLDAYFARDSAKKPYIDTTKLANSQMWAAGGVLSNPADVNTFYRAMFDGTLLSEDQLAEATEYTEIPPELGGGEYGLGLLALTLPGCTDDPEERFIGHTGGGLGHQTYSFHSADGQRQATFTWNIDAQLIGYPDEFGYAQGALMYAALCDVDLDELTAAEAEEAVEVLSELAELETAAVE
jgi:D-alanyl-D-alanine carboxypeptidase